MRHVRPPTVLTECPFCRTLSDIGIPGTPCPWCERASWLDRRPCYGCASIATPGGEFCEACDAECPDFVDLDEEAAS